MGNAEDTDELIGKTGSGNTLDGAAEDTAAVERGDRQKRRLCIFLLLMHPSAKIMKRAEYGGPEAQKHNSEVPTISCSIAQSTLRHHHQ